jgi:hypothetical protein
VSINYHINSVQYIRFARILETDCKIEKDA